MSGFSAPLRFSKLSSTRLRHRVFCIYSASVYHTPDGSLNRSDQDLSRYYIDQSMADQPNYEAQAVSMAQTLHLPQIIEERPLMTAGPLHLTLKPLWKCLTKDGEILVKKSEILTSEARMMFHASRTLSLKVPTLRAVTRQNHHTVMFMDFVPGRTVDSVWKTISRSNQKLIKQELRAEIMRMRQSTRPWIGRVDWNGNIHTADPFYDQYFPDTQNASNTMTYFRSEAEFDAHKVHQFQVHCNAQSAQQLQSLLTPLRTEYTERFVLTHADLHQENILVREVRDQKGKSTWHLAGIIDWARSGYYPEYMEYATAMKDGPYSGYWRKVMREVLAGAECSKKRLRAEDFATSWAV